MLELRRTGLDFDALAERLELKSAGAARMLHARARVALLSRLPAALRELTQEPAPEDSPGSAAP